MSHRVATLQSHLHPVGAERATGAESVSGQAQMVTVVGSCFMDYVSYVDRFPSGGETIHSKSFQKGFGGKGANQAVMVGKLGGRCRMVGRVGTDGDGADYIANFQSVGIGTEFVDRVPGMSTGLAKILVDAKGENLIVICPNATNKVDVPYLKGSAPSWLADSQIVLLQNETPLDANLWALEEASRAGKVTVFIPAPAPTPDQLPKMRPAMKHVSIFAPNQHEASVMLGYPVNGMAEGMKAAVDLRDKVMRPDSQVCITMGKDGAIVLEKGAKQAVHVPPFPVERSKVVDTTGAGDCWAGALCYFLSLGETSLAKASAKANQVAAYSVQKKGTQASYPSKAELPASLFV